MTDGKPEAFRTGGGTAAKEVSYSSLQHMTRPISRKQIWIAALVLLIAFGFRLFVALRLPNDTPDDGRVYAQIARNVLEHHVYCMKSGPLCSSLIRLPVTHFPTAIYSIAGHTNNTAVASSRRHRYRHMHRRCPGRFSMDS